MISPSWESCTHSVSLCQNVRYGSAVYLGVLLVFSCLFVWLLVYSENWGNANSQQSSLIALWAVLKISLLIIDFCWAAACALVCDSIIVNSQLAVCLALRAWGAAGNPSECLLQSLMLQRPGLVLFPCWGAWVASVWAALDKFCCHGFSDAPFSIHIMV